MAVEEDLDGTDRFDSRSDIINTIVEALMFLKKIELHRGAEKDKVYAMYKDGYFAWMLDTANEVTGFDGNGDLAPYPFDAAEFVDRKMQEGDTIGFMAMDERSLKILARREDFSRKYLECFGLGVLKTLAGRD